MWLKRALLVVVLLGQSMPLGFAEEVSDPIHGVVQVIGYENLYGKEPKMLGRWSASVIDSKGLLLTNNHVVDDGFGGVLDGFVVCLTQDFSQRPDCHFTASLVARDITRDIALLRIDPVDIFGNTVKYNQFSVLTLADEYTPTPQDEVVAVGYPWIGADTITQTVGVVAGTQEYNGYTYIKTDALIAGGNSGGPLMYNGEVIGVNTFGIGYGDSLGYALWSTEAQAFIDENKNISPTSGFDPDTFRTSLRQIEDINTSSKINDDLFAMQLPAGYRVVEYVPGKKLSSWQMLPDNTSIQYFTFSRSTTPTLASEDDFLFYLQMQGIYQPGYHKYNKIQLGGREAYDIFDKSDPSEGLAWWWKQYVVQLNEHELLRIDLQAPTYNESLFDEAKAQLDAFLDKVQFQSSIDFSPTKSLTLAQPAVTFKLSKEWGTPIGWEPSSLWDLRYSNGLVHLYLGELYNTLTLKVYPQTRDLWKGLPIDEVMKTQTQYRGYTNPQKTLISVQGYDGYLLCNDNNGSFLTRQNNWISTSSCQAYIVVDDDPEFPYMVEVALTAQIQDFPLMKQLLAVYLEQGIDFHSGRQGPTDVSSGLGASHASYDDLGNQSLAFKKSLEKLLWRGLLPQRASFKGDTPVTWWIVVEYWARYVLGENFSEASAQCGADKSYACVFSKVMVPAVGGEISLWTLLQQFEMDLDAYATDTLLYDFDRVMELALAGVNFPYDGQHLQNFEELADQLYPVEKKQLEDWAFGVYGKRKIPLSEVVEYATYRPESSWYRHPRTWLQSYPQYSTEPIRFTADNDRSRWNYVSIIDEEAKRLCGNPPSFGCYYKLQDEGYEYAVLTLGNLIGFLMNEMDAAFFDPTLIEKKEEGGYGYY
jgi:S1-C subfamily serine protease